jgi:predicted alpha/beta-fold hydrolase
MFELSDGGEVALDWFMCPDKDKTINRETSTKPLLVLIPGLTGDHTKMYMISSIKAAHKQGYDCVIANYRGLAGVPLKVRILFLNLLF